MENTPKIKVGKSFKSTHKIDEVDYRKDILICICGWEGRAYDNGSGDKKDWPNHRKTAEPIGVEIDNPYSGRLGSAPRRGKTIVRPKVMI